MAAFKAYQSLLHRALVDIEARLGRTAYLCGDQVSIADLSAACELDQGCMVGLDLSKYPKTAAWLHRMTIEDAIMNETAQKMR
eukprot:CAMPEP_0170458872 /NCGR_PEP_ID=MMETSP0123-20130129/5713_1 /TAXON_ID=182087 /ORGANISM="Favella ehrenbergii, Strain Fehren 1" /LENGTH=82 /DNA_ID=CAMNT_0010723197 /DNA_START=365 /DNA_END=610 /DNA_ORIENTATION=-